MSSQKGARSKLADVLADIKSSRAEDEYDYNNHDITPTPAKRRSAVNYVALSGHTPRSTRNSANANSSQSQTNQEAKTTTSSSSTVANSNSSNNNNNTNNSNSTTIATTKTRTYILKLFHKTVDLAQFTGDEFSEEQPLYPVCRAWVHGHRPSQGQHKNQPVTLPAKVAEKSNGSPCATQQDPVVTVEATTTEVLSMPPPKSKLEVMRQLKLNTDDVTEETDIRIPPSVRDFKRQENAAEMIDKSIESLSHQECMDLNRQRWKKVRSEWSEARRIHELRYEESFKILHEMSIQRGI